MASIASRFVPWRLRAPQQGFFVQIARFVLLMSTWILLIKVIIKESKDSNLTRNLSDCWENSTDLYSDSVSITSLSKCLIDRLYSGWLEKSSQGNAWREPYNIVVMLAPIILAILYKDPHEERSRVIGSHRFQMEPDYDLIIRHICDVIAHVRVALVAWVAVLMQERSTDEDRTVEIHLDPEDYIDVASAASTWRTRRAVEEQDEDSTMGIDVDPFHFEGTTVTWRTGSAVEEQGTDSATELTWRTGKPGDEQDVDAARSFDYHAARCITDNLKEGNKSPLTEPRTTPSDDDETKILGQHFTSETEGDAKNDETPIEVPPEILARGSSALDSYFKALADGRTSIKRVPIMLTGQDRAGKTSLKKSLKGICFDPEEDSTVGIDVDPSHFKVTTETWRTGTAGDEQDADEALSFDYHTARWIVDDLRKSNESRPLIQTGTTELKTASDTDETKITRQYVRSETEGDAKRDETLVEPATVPNEEALNNSSSPIEHNPKSLSDSTRYIPEEIAVGTETFLKGNFEDNRENIYSCLFDFAGQSVYYDTHPLFLTARAIYCLVYNLSFNPDDPAKPLMKQGVYQKYQDTFNLKTNFDYLDYWMRSVASVANTTKTATEAGLLPPKLPSVFLVCTHADAPYDKNSHPRDLAYEILGRLREKPYGVHLFGVYVVDNRKSGTAHECPEVIRLRQHVLAFAEQLPYINEAIPIKWLKFEKAIITLKEKGIKCISFKDAKDIASNACNVNEEREIKALLEYLHDLRIIIHFDDSPELNKLVILDPQWLIDVFKKVITVQPAYQCEDNKLLDKWTELEKYGLLDEKLLRHMWKSLSDDEETYQSLISIMEKFSLMCPWPLDASDASGNKSYLVPSMLKSHPPKEISELVASSQLSPLFLRFEDGHVPAGLFPRLVLKIFQWGEEAFCKPAKPHLFCNFARYFISTDDCSVIFVCHSSFIEIIVPNANIGHDVIEYLVSRMSYSPHFQRDNTSSNVTFTRAVCSQICLTLEHMRHEFCWLKNMRYEMSITCPICCNRGAVNFCLDHSKQGCREEECLHFWPISKLRTANVATFCTRSASAKNTRVPVSQFTHWFPPFGYKVSQSGSDDSDKNLAPSGEGPLLPENLQIQDMSQQRTDLTVTQTVVCVNELNLNVNAEFKTDVHPGAVAAVGTGSQVNLGNLLDATVRPQVTAGQSSYDISVSGGNAVIGDNSELNVGTGGPSGFSSESRERQEHEDNRDNRVEDVD